MKKQYGLLLAALMWVSAAPAADDVTSILSQMRSGGSSSAQTQSQPAQTGQSDGYLGRKAERQQNRVSSRTNSEIDQATDKAVDKTLNKAFDKLFGQ